MPKILPIDSSTLGPIFGPLFSAAPLNDLDSGHPDERVAKTLRSLSLAEAFAPRHTVDQSMADACLAGLWLMYDFLDESHTISQSIDTPTGSYWHAIMHRREGDYDNSKYWFRRVGAHPVFGPLAEAAGELARNQFSSETDRAAARLAESRDWDSYWFVDVCAAAVQGRSTAGQMCRLVQQLECRLLFDFCFRHAVDL